MRYLELKKILKLIDELPLLVEGESIHIEESRLKTLQYYCLSSFYRSSLEEMGICADGTAAYSLQEDERDKLLLPSDEGCFLVAAIDRQRSRENPESTKDILHILDTIELDSDLSIVTSTDDGTYYIINSLKFAWVKKYGYDSHGLFYIDGNYPVVTSEHKQLAAILSCKH